MEAKVRDEFRSEFHVKLECRVIDCYFVTDGHYWHDDSKSLVSCEEANLVRYGQNSSTFVAISSLFLFRNRFCETCTICCV